VFAIAIAAKDGRAEIVRVQDDKIEGNFRSEDIKTFQILAQTLE
jgi:hypothetical protein